MSSLGSQQNLTAFQDILEERRKTSDILWITRKWIPIRALEHPVEPHLIRQAVRNSYRVREIISQLSSEQGVKPEDLYKQVDEQLTEIGHHRQIPVVRWIGLLVTKVLKKTCTGLMVNEDSIKRLKSTMGNTPIIFAPSHRSYADFVLMAFVCFHYSIEIPCVAAGMDFLSMWIMGQMLRECCAFFMRRSFTGDRLYWTVFSEYVRTLLTAGNAPVEFFIEGTRSRSAKSLVPKYGFMSMALEPFFTGQIPDVMVVPINISYDRMLEETLFSYELLGIPKPKESTSGLIKALNVLDEKYGRIHIDFGKPFSVRCFLEEQGVPRPIHASGPVQCQIPTEDEMAITRLLSHNIVRKQQQLSVLSPFNLVAVILNNHFLTNRIAQIPLSDLVREVSWFQSVIETFGAVVDIVGDVESAVRESLRIHKSLVTLTHTDVVQLKAVYSPTSKIDVSRLRGHKLNDQTMMLAVPLLMLQHYVNPTLHFLASPAMVTTVMQNLGQNSTSRDEVFSRYQSVRAVLTHEFVLYKAWENKEFDEALRVLDLVNIVEATQSGHLVLGNHRKLQILLCNLLYPFIAGYLALGHVMSQICSAPRSERDILRETQRHVEHGLMSGEVWHPAALSLDTLSCGVQAFSSVGATCRIKKNGEVLYIAFRKEIKSLIEKLEQLNVQPGQHVDMEKSKWQQVELSHTIPAKL